MGGLPLVLQAYATLLSRIGLQALTLPARRLQLDIT